jgi:hypothetical protein
MCANPPEETIEHMLFHCPFTTLGWEKVGMNRHNNNDRKTIIQRGKDHWHKPMLMEIFLVSAWNIWKERNNLLFKGIALNIDSWTQRVKSDLLLLVHGTKQDLHSFISNFVDNL